MFTAYTLGMKHEFTETRTRTRAKAQKGGGMKITNTTRTKLRNTNSREYTDALKAYLAPIIESKAGDYGKTVEGNPFQWVISVARAEVAHEFNRHGDQAGIEYWLSGLAIDIAFNYGEIIEVACCLHGVETLDEKTADKIIEQWFKHIALKILQFSRA